MPFCPNCNHEIAANVTECVWCGAMFGSGSEWQPLAAPPNAGPLPAEAVYFPVSCSKLAVMTMSTLGFYVIYWFYQNWNMERRRAGRGWPILLTAFAPLTSYLLFDAMRNSLVRHALPKIDAGLLALMFLAFNVLFRLPDPYWMLGTLWFVPLVTAQDSVNKLNEQVAPDAPRNERYSGWNIAAIVVGALIWLLVIAGFFLEKINGSS